MKNKKRISKKIFMILISIFCLNSIFLLSPNNSAQAATIAYGGSGSGGTGSSPGKWWQVSGADGSQGAWNTFVNKWTSHTAPGYTWYPPGDTVKVSAYNAVNEAGSNAGISNLASICMKSQYIWFRINTNHNTWVNPRYTGKETSIVLANGTPWNFTAWNSAKNNGGSGIMGNPYADIICSAQYTPPDKTGSRVEYKTETDSNQINGVYSTYLQASPLMPSGMTSAEQTTWYNNHETQTTDVQNSSFGNWYNNNVSTINSLDSKTGSTLTNTYNSLVSSSSTALNPNNLGNPTINLSSKNQTGFAQGGIFNFTQNSKNATVSLNKARTYQRTVTYTETWNGSSYVEKAGTEKDGAWTLSNVNKVAGKPTTAQLSSYTVTKAWQIIHAQCNQSGLNAAKNAAGLTELSNQAAQGTMKTKVYTSQNDLPLGNSSNSNSALSATASSDFYYGPFNANHTARNLTSSSCMAPITCLSAKTSSSTSDSKNNVQNKYKYSPNGTYGAQGDSSDSSKSNMSSDTFTFFRDNKSHNIRLDLWYLTLKDASNNLGITVDSNQAALMSNFIFSNEGTPTGNLFKVTDNNDDFTSGTTSNSIIKSANSEVNTIKVSGAWASNPDKPQQFNANWAYKANVVNVIPTAIDSSGATTKDTSVNYSFYAQCPATLNTTSSVAPEALSRSTSDLNENGTNIYSNTANKHVTIKFVRDVAGKDK